MGTEKNNFTRAHLQSSQLSNVRGGLLGLVLLAAGCGAPAPPAQPSPPFPAELVAFEASPHGVLFAGRGGDHWDEKIRERGWIMRDGERYRLWYSGYQGSRDTIIRLGYAESSDGINWERRDQPLVLDSWIEDMMIVKKDDQLYMFAEGENDRTWLWQSSDGIDWQPIEQLDVRQMSGEPISDAPFGTPVGWYEDGIWSLFYERGDLGIWLAQSNDMKVWTNVSDEPVLSLGPERYDRTMIAMNQVIKQDGWYYAYYQGSGSSSSPKDWCTAIAASRDLVDWTKYSENPLLPCADNKSSGILVRGSDGTAFYTMHPNVVRHRPINGN